jgi:hypothetical protein
MSNFDFDEKMQPNKEELEKFYLDRGTKSISTTIIRSRGL